MLSPHSGAEQILVLNDKLSGCLAKQPRISPTPKNQQPGQKQHFQTLPAADLKLKASPHSAQQPQHHRGEKKLDYLWDNTWLFTYIGVLNFIEKIVTKTLQKVNMIYQVANLTQKAISS